MVEVVKDGSDTPGGLVVGGSKEHASDFNQRGNRGEEGAMSMPPY